jgi:hypothetical protein
MVATLLALIPSFEHNSGNQYIGYWWEAFETWFPKICAIRKREYDLGKEGVLGLSV